MYLKPAAGPEPQEGKNPTDDVMCCKRTGKIKGTAKAAVDHSWLRSGFSLVLKLEQLPQPDVYQTENTLSSFSYFWDKTSQML